MILGDFTLKIFFFLSELRMGWATHVIKIFCFTPAKVIHHSLCEIH